MEFDQSPGCDVTNDTLAILISVLIIETWWYMSKTVQENVKYQQSAIVLYVFNLSGENKICSTAKLGVVLCISSYKTKYLRWKSKLWFLYSSIEYMFVKPNLKRFETNSNIR